MCRGSHFNTAAASLISGSRLCERTAVDHVGSDAAKPFLSKGFISRPPDACRGRHFYTAVASLTSGSRPSGYAAVDYPINLLAGHGAIAA